MTAGRAFRQQRVEQPQLRPEIILDGRMIVHVVAAEIGEGAGGKPHAIQPALVEAVAGGLHRGMGDAGVREFGEQLMQRDRVGRGQRAVLIAAGRDHAGRADAGGRANPACSQICRVNEATEVLPLVPVTATMVSGCLP